MHESPSRLEDRGRAMTTLVDASEPRLGGELYSPCSSLQQVSSRTLHILAPVIVRHPTPHTILLQSSQ